MVLKQRKTYNREGRMNTEVLKPREDRYTANVREVTNRVWTSADRSRVYTLRQKGICAKEIADILGVNKTQVHNETRLAIRAVNEECYHCGRPLKENEKRQPAMEDINKRAFEIYQERTQHGLPGTSEGDWNQAVNELRIGTISLCKKCTKKESVYKKEHRENALERNMCGYCFSRPVIKGYCACRKCLSGTHRRRNKAGLCGNCGKHPIGKNKVALCDVCAPIMAEKTRQYRARHQQD
jgi:hypothetical protein